MSGASMSDRGFQWTGIRTPTGELPPPQREAVQKAYELFRTPHYLRHNQRRQEHLASLALDLANRSVLEVGAGIGDHTTFFLDRGCTVLATEPRPENCNLFAFMMRSSAASGYQAAARCALLPCAVEELEAHVSERFDIVYCYGLLYHVPDPALALAQLDKRCADLLLLETSVSLGDAPAVRDVAEIAEAPTQAVTGRGVRPTRPWLFAKLKEHFAHVYVPATQPAHEEFPLDWAAPPAPGIEYQRAVFVASRRPIANPRLLDHLPQRQTAA
jgi:SAM-dependent methyltransferase